MTSVPDTVNNNPFNRNVIREFRERGGQVSDFGAVSLLLLTTRGARTGLERTTPLVYLPDGDRLVVFASNGGSPTAPGWYHNLRASTEVVVELGTERFTARHALVPEEEHETFWQRAIAQDANFAGFRRRTSRSIPLVALTRVPADAA
ncbi:nitroreductase/quinone reductase family protein [Streptomyces sp. NBRC 109706]|uniref:nitroreductase/quinone reductase family protein n=1 Tax=Streptomyces sp. NBRC 109706 TaxID=1550035 RepID=UPI000780D342|nr:nitroreductase/quinone reductase family protein [Streptomyces sp. NBRC 109706]